MPSAMQPRPHQLQCFQRIVAENTIVNMPSGTDRTFVAVLAIEHFRAIGKVLYVVPTRPLVIPQAEYVRDHCSRPIAVEGMQGAKNDQLNGADWQDLLNSYDVLVGTAEVFRKALVDSKFISLEHFSLLVLDECHNATGNSPMANIMRDAVHCHIGKKPRVLGLTSYDGQSALKGVEKKRRGLESLLQAQLFSPEVGRRSTDFECIAYLQESLPAMEQVVECKIHALLSIAEQCGVPLKETQIVVRRGVHVFSELGLAAFIFFLRECVAPQVQATIETMEELLPVRSRHEPQEALRNIPNFRQAMRGAADQLSRDGSLTDFPEVTDRASKLLELIKNLQQEGKQNRIIVFCEKTVLAQPLAHLLEQHTGMRTGTCTGVGSMTHEQRKKALQSFRSGLVPLLACTAALEDSLDVISCEVVVRFSQLQTAKSNMQCSGRAKAWNAQVFYFDNDPGRELTGASPMETNAKESLLSSTVEFGSFPPQGRKYNVEQPINHKGQLNELTRGNVCYNTKPALGGFHCTVLIGDGQSFSGATSAPSKKAAEQLAAEAALNAMRMSF